MDGIAPDKPIKFNRWLPYWAVFQADIQQTLRSWVYRLWLLVSVGAAVGYLLYRFALDHEAGIVQPASKLISDVLHWTVLGSGSLIIMLTAGTISSERGTMADSVLSRGISRHQYFMGKWHSRLLTVLVTFLATSGTVLVGSVFLLHEDLSAAGCGLALATVTMLLAAVVTCGVTVSALCNSTVLGITLLWVGIYGGGFGLSLLPARFPAPDRLLNNLPFVLRGYYDIESLVQVMIFALVVSVGMAGVGLVHFARRDI